MGQIPTSTELYSRSNALLFEQYNVFRLSIPRKIFDATLGLLAADSWTVKRQNLLLQRAKKEIMTSAPIPLLEYEADEQEYTKAITPTVKSKESTSTVGFLKRIRAHNLITQTLSRRVPVFSDYVREENLPIADPQLNILKEWFGIRRPLKPNRKERSFWATEKPDGCNIVVQVLQGSNIPTRKTKDGKSVSFALLILNENMKSIC